MGRYARNKKKKKSDYPKCNHHLNHHTTNTPHDFHHNYRNYITGKTSNRKTVYFLKKIFTHVSCQIKATVTTCVTRPQPS